MHHIRIHNNWSYNELLQQLPRTCIPYNSKNLDAFIEDCFYYLKSGVPELESVKVTKNESNTSPMLIVSCFVKENAIDCNAIVNNVYSVWEQHLALENTWYTTEQSVDNNNTIAELSFLTHNTMYITGKIALYFSQNVPTQK